MAKLSVNRGYGRSLGNLIDIASGQAAQAMQDEHWLQVEQVGPGKFAIVGNNLTSPSAPDLGLSEWGPEVENLDHNSDAFGCFGMSQHLRWQEVDIYPSGFDAPSMDRIKAALEHVCFCAWDPGDI